MIGDKIYTYRVTFKMEYGGDFLEALELVKNTAIPFCENTIEIKEIEKEKTKRIGD